MVHVNTVKKMINAKFRIIATSERLLLSHERLGFLASRGEEFNLGPVTRLDRSELLCNKVLLKYKRVPLRPPC